jgi:hypothetical protein
MQTKRNKTTKSASTKSFFAESNPNAIAFVELVQSVALSGLIGMGIGACVGVGLAFYEGASPDPVRQYDQID